MTSGAPRAGRYQPRTRMDADSIAELAESIKAQGMIQPILVRPIDGGAYEIIAGERRWRAAQKAGLRRVPIVVRDVADGGGNYTWTIDFGDGNSTNGTEMPAATRHTYDEMGNYTVNLTLANDAGESKASINVTAEDFATQREEGAWENGAAACATSPRAEWDLGAFDEFTHKEFEVNNTTWNMSFSAEFDAPDASSWIVDFYDEDDPTARFNLATQGQRQPGSAIKPITCPGGELNVGGHSVASSTPRRPEVPAPM